MQDEKTRHSVDDQFRINLEYPPDVLYWTKELGINEELLRKVVEVVGNRVDAVREHLGK
jgi:hypothetical protein